MFRALRHRNYRLFFIGQGVSLIGTWMQLTALLWLIYRITGSAWMLGVVGFAGQIPSLFIAPFAGVLTEGRRRQRLLVLTQSLATGQAAVLAILALSGAIEIWHVVALALIQGLINSFDMPVRQAFTVEMIDDRRDLGNAISLNSFVVNGAKLIGPALAGLIIHYWGEGLCFSLNAASYLAVIATLLAMRIRRPALAPAAGHFLRRMAEGLRYVWTHPTIRAVLLLVVALSLVGMPYGVLLPIFATDVFHGQSKVFGYLVGASGAGALLGAAFLSLRRSVDGLGRLTAVATAIFGVGLALFSLSGTLWLSLGLMVISGFGLILTIASCNTMVQWATDDDKRGRVMSLYTVAFIGMSPFGNLLAGGLASLIGSTVTMLIFGICCIAAAAVFAAGLPHASSTAPSTHTGRTVGERA